MTQFLPPNLLALFAPRDPIPYKQPTQPLTWEKDRERSPYIGIGHIVNLFEDPKDTPPPTRGEKKAEKKKRRIREKAEQRAQDIVEEVKAWDPHNDPSATGDAFKTLFVGRMNYDTTESKLRREFETFGKIRKVHVVTNKATGKPRGYAFVEYEKEHDMHAAYKSADGKKIDGRRVLVDVERGRTVKGWRPRRLGGGLGTTRSAPDEEGGNKEKDERDRERDRVRGGDRGGEREKIDRDRDRERRDRRSPERTRDRSDRRHRSRERERERPRDRDRDRDRDKRRDKDRDRRDKDGDRRDKDGDRRDKDGDRRDKDGDRRDKDGDRRDRDRDRSDRDRKRDGDRRASRKDDAGDGDSKKDDRSRESRHRHRDRSRERDGRRDRDRHRDRAEVKIENVKQETTTNDYPEERPPEMMNQSTNDGKCFGEGPEGDGENQGQAAKDNGYYQENTSFKEENMDQQSYENTTEMQQGYEESSGQY